MRMRIDSTWLTAAIGIAAAGMALMYPSAGIALLVLAAAVLLAGVRVEDSHIIWLSKGTHRRYIGIALLCAAIGAGGWYFWTQCYCDGNLPPPAPSRLPLQSRYGAWVFVCATRPIDFEDWAQFYKANVLSKDNNDGFLVSISTTPDGLHFEKEALTEKAKKIVGEGLAARGINKLIVDAKIKSNTEMLVSANFDLPQNERTALLVKPDPAEKVMIQVRQTIEDFFGLPDGQCRMI